MCFCAAKITNVKTPIDYIGYFVSHPISRKMSYVKMLIYCISIKILIINDLNNYLTEKAIKTCP